MFYHLQGKSPKEIIRDEGNMENEYKKEIENLKSKLLKHETIWKSNYEQAENEVRKVDEIYHDTVNMVLQVLSLPTYK